MRQASPRAKSRVEGSVQISYGGCPRLDLRAGIEGELHARPRCSLDARNDGGQQLRQPSNVVMLFWKEGGHYRQSFLASETFELDLNHSKLKRLAGASFAVKHHDLRRGASRAIRLTDRVHHLGKFSVASGNNRLHHTNTQTMGIE